MTTVRRRCAPASEHRGRLWSAFGLLVVFMIVEAIAALTTGSLALLSDAGHMFTDVLGIGMALAAITATRRATDDPQRTFGLYRLEVLAALANAVLLFGVAIYVLVEAVRRFDRPADRAGRPDAGRSRSSACWPTWSPSRCCAPARKESINLRGAYLEVLGDLLGSVGVIVAALVIATTGWWYADPMVAVAIGLFILPADLATGPGRRPDPGAGRPGAPRRAHGARPGSPPSPASPTCTTCTSGRSPRAWRSPRRTSPWTAGAEVGAVLAAARGALHDDFDIAHATLQVEPRNATDDCGPSEW